MKSVKLYKTCIGPWTDSLLMTKHDVAEKKIMGKKYKYPFKVQSRSVYFNTREY